MEFALTKLALIAAVALVAVGPKDLPRAARAAGRAAGRLMAMRDRFFHLLRDPESALGAHIGLAEAGELRLDHVGSPAWPVGQPLPAAAQGRASMAKRGPAARGRAARRARARAMPAAASRFAPVARPGDFHG